MEKIKLKNFLEKISLQERAEEREERRRKEEKEDEIRMQEREERKRWEKREDENREEEKTRRMQRLEQKAKEKEDQRLEEEENKLLRIQKDEEKQLDICRREKNDLEEKENIRKQIREKENSATRSLINEISLIEHSLKKAYQINVIELEDEGLLENKKNIVSIDQLRFKLMEKVTKLCGTIHIDYESRNNIVEKFSEIPDNISFLHEEYVTKVKTSWERAGSLR